MRKIFSVNVRIETDTLENAERVIEERVFYDEDYGFYYRIDHDAVAPVNAPTGIVIDADTIRAAVADLIDNATNPDTLFPVPASELSEMVNQLDDSTITNIIHDVSNNEMMSYIDGIINMITHKVIDASVAKGTVHV